MSVTMSGVGKSYGSQRVLDGLELVLEDGGRYCLMGPSGAGKTTLLRILLGLERPDAGSIEGLPRGSASMVFQEDRLCSALTPVENIALVMPGRASRRALRALLAEVLPAACLDKPALNLSGGQRRRVSLVRAMAFPGSLVVMDEPFTGLDRATKQVVIDFVARHLDGRTLLVSTHGEDDAALLDAEKVQLAEIQGK